MAADWGGLQRLPANSQLTFVTDAMLRVDAVGNILNGYVQINRNGDAFTQPYRTRALWLLDGEIGRRYDRTSTKAGVELFHPVLVPGGRTDGLGCPPTAGKPSNNEGWRLVVAPDADIEANLLTPVVFIWRQNRALPNERGTPISPVMLPANWPRVFIP